MSERVWYVSYGSNLLSERFLCYIQGGTAPGSTKPESGCRDRTLPHDERAVFLQHQLFFALRSGRWQGAVAFIDHEPGDNTTYARAYNITREQFCDVVRQENNDPELEVPIDAALADGHAQVGNGWYSRLVKLGELDGEPMLSFTHPEPLAQHEPAKPSKAYLTVIIAGLQECYGLKEPAVSEYLLKLPGVSEHYRKGILGKLYESALEL